MYHNGGPVILVQVENEYGSYYACDANYLRHLANFSKSLLGSETTLFTTDGDDTGYLKCGSIPEVFATIDFGIGTDIASVFAMQRSWNNGGPYVNSEFYAGWLDHWGEPHSTTPSDQVASNLDRMLALDASVNIYMFIGGTNFGFRNGANGGGTDYTPDPTSYDYDAPLSEAADLRWKWAYIRNVIMKYRVVPTYDVKNSTKRAFGFVNFTEGVSLFDALDAITTNRVDSTDVQTFESLGLDAGFVLYRGQAVAGNLDLTTVHDRAYVFVDGKRYGIVQRGSENILAIAKGRLDILVENQGRLNYGGQFVEFKGLVAGVKIDGRPVQGWANYGFNLSRIRTVPFSKTLPVGMPAFYRAVFNVDLVADTFLNPTGFTKGVAFVNGFNIGRYWTIGPQLTLFVPSQLLVVGDNELIVFEEENLSPTMAMSFDSVHQISII
jgi:beta-galactosidase